MIDTRNRCSGFLSKLIVGGTAMALGTLSAQAQQASGEELRPDFTISAGNIDSVRNSTFEGTRIEDLISDHTQWMIRNQKLKITLKHYEVTPSDPRLLETTERYKGQASINGATNEILNFTAGIPFADVRADDKNAGIKIVWNTIYGGQHGDHFTGPFTFVFVDGDAGIERVQKWIFRRMKFAGRYTQEPATLGDGSVFHRSLLFATFPQDIKGIGTYSIRYMDPRLEDIWAYIRTVRRIRRLSGGAWVDPIGGTDMLQDDIQIFNAHPAWYKSFRLLGRKQHLLIANSQSWVQNVEDRASWVINAATPEAEFPRMNLTEPPYWNIKDDKWEPRDTFVVEAVPPEYHPYTKKILYVDRETWQIILGETFDKKGDFWKWMTFPLRTYLSADGYRGPEGRPAMYHFTNYGLIVDTQRRHATFFNVPHEFQINPPGMQETDFSLTVLEAAGR